MATHNFAKVCLELPKSAIGLLPTCSQLFQQSLFSRLELGNFFKQQKAVGTLKYFTGNALLDLLVLVMGKSKKLKRPETGHTYDELEQNRQYKAETKETRSAVGKKKAERQKQSQELLKKLKPSKFLITPVSKKSK